MVKRLHCYSIVVSIATCIAARAALGQQCTPPPHPAFEFQVSSPAAFVRDSTHPHPAENRFSARMDDSSVILVSFVVDTMGVPHDGSLRVLKAPSATAANAVRTLYTQWRFTPSRIGACKVEQLVQTTVVW
jgi:hypothetical protein